MNITSEKILVVDFGSKNAQLYARRVREQNVFCQMVGHEVTVEQIQQFNPVGLIFTDNPLNNTISDAVRQLGLPILEGMELTDTGTVQLSKFLKDTCKCSCTWTMEQFAQNAIEEIRQQVGTGRVVCGLSGGVDSSVVAALIYKAIGDRLSCIFVDTGLMRKNEAESVIKTFSQQFKTDLHALEAEELFLSKLAGVEDPQQKRKIIGHVFIDCFAQEAKKLGDAQFLAQGTIYPDIIESGIPGCKAKVIKHHHNVGGLPEDMKFELVEPLKDLFKDEVRQLGLVLGLPEEMVWRQPFPGPGLGVRCLGELTKAKLDTLREADAIVREELEKSGWARKTSQTFAVLLPVNSVGVKDGERTYENAVAIRSVNTTDFMTATWTHFPYEVLETMSDRIIAEVPGVNRVVYDISKKPSATIEWE